MEEYMDERLEIIIRRIDEQDLSLIELEYEEFDAFNEYLEEET